MNEDDDITPEEAAEAEALARALESGKAEPGLPADAWQAAMLLRARDAEPPPMSVALARAVAARRPKKKWLPWAASTLALAATVVIAVMSTSSRRDAPAAMSEAPEPARAAEARPSHTVADQVPDPLVRLEQMARDLTKAENVSPERCKEVCDLRAKTCGPRFDSDRCQALAKPILDKCACPTPAP